DRLDAPRVLALAAAPLDADRPLPNTLPVAARAALLASPLAALLGARAARAPGPPPGRGDEVVVRGPRHELVDVCEGDERVRQVLVELVRVREGHLPLDAPADPEWAAISLAVVEQGPDVVRRGAPHAG